MKKVISAFAVLAIVGSALAFKPLGQGQIFCKDTCLTVDKINYKEDINGTVQDPCSNGIGGEFKLNASNVCVVAVAPFTQTLP